MNQILQFAAPIAAAALTGGGIVAFFSYLSSRGVNAAKAQHINITGEITLSEGWQRYAEKLEKRMGDLERKYDEAMKVKDGEIERLQKRVLDLETELSGYKGVASQKAVL